MKDALEPTCARKMLIVRKAGQLWKSSWNEWYVSTAEHSQINLPAGSTLILLRDRGTGADWMIVIAPSGHIARVGKSIEDDLEPI